MINVSFKNQRSIVGLNRLIDFIHRVDMKVRHFFLPAIASTCASICDGMCIALLAPFLNGCIKTDFTFINNWQVVAWATNFLGIEHRIRNLHIFIFLLTLLFVTMLMANFFKYLSSISLCYQLRKFASNVRMLLFTRYMEYSKLYFDRETKGRLAQVITGHVNQISYSLTTINGVVNAFNHKEIH